MEKIYSLFILLVLVSTYSLKAQESKSDNLLITDNWGKETFKFPLEFAKTIPYVGIEEAYFPKNWGFMDSTEFWTYAIIWEVNLDTVLTENVLENQLLLYFDGLMEDVNGGQEKNIRKTSALFKHREETKITNSFVGKVRIYDAFRTKKPITLNVLVDQYLHSKTKSSSIVFKFSPKEFDDDVWRTLHKIQLKTKFTSK